MPIRPSGIPKQQTAAAPTPDLNVVQQVTTGSTGNGTVTFPAAVDPSSVQATVNDTGSSGMTVQVVSVVGAVVTLRTFRLSTGVILGGPVATPAPCTVNVTARKVSA